MAEGAAFNAVRTIGMPGDAPLSERREQAIVDFGAMNDYFRRNEVWLEPRSAEVVARLAEFLLKILNRALYEMEHDDEAWTEIDGTFRTEMPAIRTALKAEFRRLLGVPTA